MLFLGVVFFNGSDKDINVPVDIFDIKGFEIFDVERNTEFPIDDKRVNAYYDPRRKRKEKAYVVFPSGAKEEREFSINDAYDISDGILYRLDYYATDFLEEEGAILRFVSEPLYFTVTGDEVKMYYRK